jgi:ABC-2 type transport system permease protein
MTAFLRFEIVRTLRNVRFLVMLIAFPVLLYLIYAKQQGMSQGLTVATLLLVSMAVYSGMGSAMFASGPQLARERGNGWMRQLRISPISTPGWFAAKLIQAILLIGPGRHTAARPATEGMMSVCTPPASPRTARPRRPDRRGHALRRC